jgi:hypothetical protein
MEWYTLHLKDWLQFQLFLGKGTKKTLFIKFTNQELFHGFFRMQGSWWFPGPSEYASYITKYTKYTICYFYSLTKSRSLFYRNILCLVQRLTQEASSFYYHKDIPAEKRKRHTSWVTKVWVPNLTRSLPALFPLAPLFLCCKNPFTALSFLIWSLVGGWG